MLKFQNKEFADKRSMFDYIKSNKDVLIADKKAKIYKSIDKGIGVQTKSIKSTAIKGLEINKDYYYIVVNTTKVLDSHQDLHVNGIWNKTAKEKSGKNYLTLDHEIKVNSIVARRKDVEMFVSEIPFSSVGKSYEGTTEALIYKVHKDKVINQVAKEWLDSGEDIEASVRMRYIDIELALLSDDKEDKAERETYDKYHTQIANKEEFESIDYFWVVKQASNEMESSLVPLGSNSATGQLTEPSQDTQKESEPLKNTPIDYNYLFDNLKN